MSVIPEVKCRRCGESFSALRTRCPNCGTRRVTQSGRTPGATPGTVKGTASYERAETNTKWQMIFGLILVVAVILAVIVMVSTSLNTQDVSTGKVTLPPATAEITETTPAIIVEQPPTPPPTPTPTVQEIKIFYYNKELPEFTMHEGDEPLTIKATAYPVESFADATYKWSVDDESCLKLTPGEDTSECKVEILSRKDGGVKLSVTCNGYEYSIRVYLLK